MARQNAIEISVLLPLNTNNVSLFGYFDVEWFMSSWMHFRKLYDITSKNEVKTFRFWHIYSLKWNWIQCSTFRLLQTCIYKGVKILIFKYILLHTRYIAPGCSTCIHFRSLFHQIISRALSTWPLLCICVRVFVTQTQSLNMHDIGRCGIKIYALSVCLQLTVLSRIEKLLRISGYYFFYYPI